jgi:hypothetical protein
MTKPRKKSTQPGQMESSDKKSLTRHSNTPLAHELLQLIDDINEVTAIAAFHCQSLTRALAEHDSMDKDVYYGAKRCTELLQSRLQELKNKSSHFHERFVAENK